MLRASRVAQATVEHHGCHPAASHLLAGNQRECAVGIKVALQHHRAARHPQRNAGQIVGTHVVQRAHHQQLVFLVQTQCGDVIEALPRHVAVGVHHALGTVGGAAGVHQSIQVVRLGRMLRHGSKRLAIGKRTTVALRRVVHPDGLQRIGHGSAQFLVGQQQTHTRVPGDVVHLVLAQAVVHRQEHGPHMADGQRQLQECGAVLHQQRHHVARTYAARHQHGGRALHALLQLGIAQALPVIDQRQAFGFGARPPRHTGTH
ncbi:hypothetical protein SDC9_128367 [bioreactor metagenome]|uniref:Uncharacterized protein n=1 Tax=bioreactor metagenome TaxID=1076179 RepID=A0A645CWT3_9ZZZZ